MPCRTRLYTGVLARIDLTFKVIKADKKRNIRPSVHVKVRIFFTPIMRDVFDNSRMESDKEREMIAWFFWILKIE